MTTDPIDEAVDLLEHALRVMDAHRIGTMAAPHVDLGLSRLRAERDAARLVHECAAHQSQ